MKQTLITFLTLMTIGLFVFVMTGPGGNIRNFTIASLGFLIVTGSGVALLNRPLRASDIGVLVVLTMFVLVLGAMLFVDPVEEMVIFKGYLIIAMVVMLAILTVILWLGYAEDRDVRREQSEHLDLANDNNELMMKIQYIKNTMELKMLQEMNDRKPS